MSYSRRPGLTLMAMLLANALPAQPVNFFTEVDADRDGIVTRKELHDAMLMWLPAGITAASESQLVAGLDRGFPESIFASMLAARGPQNQTPKSADVEMMLAALPSQAPVKPIRDAPGK